MEGSDEGELTDLRKRTHFKALVELRGAPSYGQRISLLLLLVNDLEVADSWDGQRVLRQFQMSLCSVRKEHIFTDTSISAAQRKSLDGDTLLPVYSKLRKPSRRFV